MQGREKLLKALRHAYDLAKTPAPCKAADALAVITTSQVELLV